MISFFSAALISFRLPVNFLCPQTANLLVAVNICQFGHNLGAFLCCIGATGAESAAFGDLAQQGNHAFDHKQTLVPFTLHLRDALQQTHGIRMHGIVKQAVYIRLLDNLAQIHNCHAGTGLSHDRQIVGNENNAHVQFLIQLDNQLHNLRLNGNVQSTETIAMMKTGVVIINAARDALVNEKDMLAALESGKVRRYVTDFPNSTTAGQKGCIVIPHLGASTAEAEDNCAVMAVKEIRDYLENGNIVNSVNYPACSLGFPNKAGRIAICHRNEANMIGTFTSILGNAKVNIDAIANKSRGDFAYTLIDTDAAIPADVVKALEASDAVIRVRVIK